MTHFTELLHNLSKNNNYQNQVANIINPFSLYYICDHFYGNETTELRIPIPHTAHNLVADKDISLIKDCDIIHVQVNFFWDFCYNILPKITKKIILTTGQMFAPNIPNTFFTEQILRHNNILLWISQNPVFNNCNKYTAFPYGINPQHPLVLQIFSDSLLKLKDTQKRYEALFLPIGNHTNPLRPKFPKLPKLDFHSFYLNLAQTKFVFSPVGDRNDCYRHYEAIGFGAIPISNVNILYKNIFGKCMYYSDTDSMLSMINHNNIDMGYMLHCDKIDLEYIQPNRDLICFTYHKEIVMKKIEQIKNTL